MIDLQSKLEQIDPLKEQKAVLEQKIFELEDVSKDTKGKIQDIKSLYEKMDSLQDKNRIDLRIKLRSRLRELIKDIVIFPNGYSDTWIDKTFSGFNKDVFGVLRDHFTKVNSDIGAFLIQIDFHNGVSRTIYPKSDYTDFSFDKTKAITISKDTRFEWDFETNEQTVFTKKSMVLPRALRYLDKLNKGKKDKKALLQLSRCESCECYLENEKCPTVDIDSEIDVELTNQNVIEGGDIMEGIKSASIDFGQIQCSNYIKE